MRKSLLALMMFCLSFVVVKPLFAIDSISYSVKDEATDITLNMFHMRDILGNFFFNNMGEINREGSGYFDIGAILDSPEHIKEKLEPHLNISSNFGMPPLKIETYTDGRWNFHSRGVKGKELWIEFKMDGVSPAVRKYIAEENLRFNNFRKAIGDEPYDAGDVMFLKAREEAPWEQ